ncbi:MAG: hypothetical protein JOZ83_17460 [Silvibacterium sp.]|nr:hypothetical protein [Silvibacterium sp.]
MARTGFRWRCFALLLFVPAVSGLCEKDDSLPNAPASHAAPAVRGSVLVNCGQQVKPLDAEEKIVYWLQEQAQWTSLFPTFVSPAIEQAVDLDPKYGTDSAAFGQRLGAAALRGASMRFFSDSLLPTVTHEDPRYFRMAHGPKARRGVYAAMRVFVTRRDNGLQGFNYSAVVGHAMASALIMTYYPGPSANGGVVARTFGLSLAGLAGGHLFTEFWPDVRDRVFHHPKNGGLD